MVSLLGQKIGIVGGGAEGVVPYVYNTHMYTLRV